MSLDDPQPDHGTSVPPDPQRDDRSPRTDTSWMAPDPPPIPDRIRNAVDPKLPSLPPIPIAGVDRRWLKRGLAAGAAAVLVALVWMVWPGPGFAEADRQRWEALCDHHLAWFDRFATAVDYQDKAVLEDVGLGGVVSELDAARRHTPQDIAGQAGVAISQLRDDPPKAVQQAEAIEQTRRAHTAIERIHESFDRWPTALSLREHQAQFRSHGWDRAADLIEQHLQLAPPGGSGPVGDTLRQMVALVSHSAEIARLSQELDAELQSLAAHDDPVFQRLIDEVKSLDNPSSGDIVPPTASSGERLSADAHARLNALADRLRPLESFARRFYDYADSGRYAQLNHADFRARGRAYALLEDDGSDADAIFRAWLTECDRYRAVEDDWRPKWAEPQRKALAEIEAAAGPLHAADHPLSKSIDARLEKLGARIDTLLDQPLVSGAQHELQREREAIDRDLAELTSAVSQAGRQVDAGQMIASLREPSSGLGEPAWRSDAVDARWDAERQRLADRLERRGDRAAIEAALVEIRGQLLALIDPSSENALPSAPRFSPLSDQASHAPLFAALNRYAAAGREAALSRVLANGLPVDDRVWPTLLAKQQDRYRAAEALADEARHCDRVWRLALPLDDPTLPGHAGEPPLGGGEAFADRVEAWSDGAPWGDPGVAEAGQPIREQIAYLRAIDREDNPEVLRHLIEEAPESAAAFAAWRRWTVSASASPTTAAELDDRLTLHQRIRGHAAHIQTSDPQRGEELKAELAATGRRQWLAAFLSVNDAAEIASIAGRSEAWEIEADELPTEARFNLLLYRTRASLAKIQQEPGRDAEVLTLAQAFLARARPMEDHPEVAALLESLDAAADPAADHREHLTQAGPAQVGWELLPGPDTGVVAFRQAPWTLTFVRIDPPRGPSFYFCTTELSVGLAVEATSDAKTRKEWAGLLPDADDGDTRKGPRAWTFGSEPGGPAWDINAGRWLVDQGGYPAGLTPSPPNPRHPVNYVGAEAAAYLAARLGCRLPTIEQWHTAFAAYPVPAGVLPNLRDTTWARHAEHRRTLINSGATDVAWANSDVFRPAGGPPGDPAADSHPINDGELWFKPATAATPHPEHLVGNIAELVTAGPVDPTPLLDREVPMPVRRAAFRDRHKHGFAVLGDSALSPASGRPDEPKPFNVFTGARGYADVGVRLVFVAPKLSPARQARALLEAQPFLTGR